MASPTNNESHENVFYHHEILKKSYTSRGEKEHLTINQSEIFNNLRNEFSKIAYTQGNHYQAKVIRGTNGHEPQVITIALEFRKVLKSEFPNQNKGVYHQVSRVFYQSLLEVEKEINNLGADSKDFDSVVMQRRITEKFLQKLDDFIFSNHYNAPLLMIAQKADERKKGPHEYLSANNKLIKKAVRQICHSFMTDRGTAMLLSRFVPRHSDQPTTVDALKKGLEEMASEVEQIAYDRKGRPTTPRSRLTPLYEKISTYLTVFENYVNSIENTKLKAKEHDALLKLKNSTAVKILPSVMEVCENLNSSFVITRNMKQFNQEKFLHLKKLSKITLDLLDRLDCKHCDKPQEEIQRNIYVVKETLKMTLKSNKAIRYSI